MTTALVAIALTGATYDIHWQVDDIHLTGVIDTQTDTLTWNALPDGMGSLEWPAVTLGESIPTGEIHYEIVPYDVPDDFSGVMGDWGFLSNATTQVMNVTNYAGLGCYMGQWLCLPDGFCTGQTIKFANRGGPNWGITQIRGVDRGMDNKGILGPARVNISPISPALALGDSNFDGVFDSSDLVTVFAIGKYESGEEAWWNEGDWDGNYLFDSGDMVVAFAGGDYEKPVMAVPEPSAVVLALIGFVLVAFGEPAYCVAAVDRQP